MSKQKVVNKLTLKNTLIELGIPLLIITVLTIVHVVGSDIFFFNRAAIEQGQWWRIWTGHWAHLNVNHSLMNSAGLILIYIVFRPYFSARVWFRALLLLSVWEGCLIYFLDKDLTIYAGLSGVLHGLLVLGFCYSIRYMPLLTLVAMGIILTRVYFEQQPGYNTAYIQDFINGLVYVNAHFYGVIGGFILGILGQWKILYQWILSHLNINYKTKA